MATEKDIDIVARTVYGEARGESRLGRVAVAYTIRNRVEADLFGDGKADWWGEGYEAVCLKPWQYSCWNANDPNRPILEKLTDVNLIFSACKDIVREVLEDKITDPTYGATHYYNPKVVAEPKWAKGKSPCAIIGNHKFYKDIG